MVNEPQPAPLLGYSELGVVRVRGNPRAEQLRACLLRSCNRNNLKGSVRVDIAGCGDREIKAGDHPVYDGLQSASQGATSVDFPDKAVQGTQPIKLALQVAHPLAFHQRASRNTIPRATDGGGVGHVTG
jgi:hypothetical protein